MPTETAYSTVFSLFLPIGSRVGDVISGVSVGQVGLDVPVKFGDSTSNGSQDISQRNRRIRHFRPFFLKFDNCQPEVVSDVSSGANVGHVAWMCL